MADVVSVAVVREDMSCLPHPRGDRRPRRYRVPSANEHGACASADTKSSEPDPTHRKRRRSASRASNDPSSPWGESGGSEGGGERASSVPPSSLPTSSPPGALSDLTDEADEGVVYDSVIDVDEADDDDGEDLFDDTMEACVSAN